jgi:hypothetical protein
MSYDLLREGSVALRLDFYVTRAVYQRGLFTVLRLAVVAWWNRPSLDDLSPRLRADMGLPPDTRPVFWPEPSANPQVPPPMWRPGM